MLFGVMGIKTISVNFYLTEQNHNSLNVADNPFKLELAHTFP